MPMNNNIENPSNTHGEPKEQKDTGNSPALTKEVYRAMEMMKRVKKSNTAQFEIPSESQRMPSYLMPDALVMCQAGF
jgi:hypothetical protein